MVRSRLIFSTFAGLVLAAGLASAHGDEHATQEVSMTGEVVDLHCYMLHPDTGRGPDHAKCANSCIDRGLPVGFLVDNQVYLLLGPGHDSPKALVAGKAGSPVKITGALVDHAGVKAIQLATVEAVEAGKATSATKPAAKDAHADHNH